MTCGNFFTHSNVHEKEEGNGSRVYDPTGRGNEVLQISSTIGLVLKRGSVGIRLLILGTMGPLVFVGITFVFVFYSGKVCSSI